MIHNYPSHPFQADRRTLLKFLAGAASASLGSLAVRGQDPALHAWARVREQFLLEPGLVMVNAANLCPCPKPVLTRLLEATRDVDSNPSLQNRAQYRKLRELSRSKLAGYLRADTSELALVRNTSEGNNVVASGLDLGPGDKVVIWKENHPTNNAAWKVRAERSGFEVREVETPRAPGSPAQLLDAFETAFNDKTRVLAVTHVSNLTGTELPIREMCRRARGRNILTLVDGAQSFGAFDLNLHELGCDFFTGSAHKWFMGPREVGVLYVRQGLAKKLWPLSVGIGWEQARDKDALRFETLGQRNDAAVTALADTVDFHQSIGPDEIERRIRAMTSRLYRQLSQLKGTFMITPEHPETRAGVVVFSIDGVKPAEGVRRLYEKHRIGSAAPTGYRPGIRFSPHVYNTDQDLEHVIRAVADEFQLSG